MNGKAAKKLRKALTVMGVDIKTIEGRRKYQDLKKEFNNWSRKQKSDFSAFVESASREFEIAKESEAVRKAEEEKESEATT